MKYYPGICLGGFRTTRNIRNRIINVPAGNLTELPPEHKSAILPLELFYSKY
jgi:hypothetical protein